MPFHVVTNPIGIVMPSDTSFLHQRDPDVLRGPDIALVQTEVAKTMDLDLVITGAPALPRR